MTDIALVRLLVSFSGVSLGMNGSRFVSAFLRLVASRMRLSLGYFLVGLLLGGLSSLGMNAGSRWVHAPTDLNNDFGVTSCNRLTRTRVFGRGRWLTSILLCCQYVRTRKQYRQGPRVAGATNWEIPRGGSFRPCEQKGTRQPLAVR
jgi:hypothetical protein